MYMYMYIYMYMSVACGSHVLSLPAVAAQVVYTKQYSTGHVYGYFVAYKLGLCFILCVRVRS